MLLVRDPSDQRALDVLESRVEAFLRGELDADTLRAERVPWGVYEQRESGVFMIRIRCPGGAMDFRQLRTIADIVRTKRTRIHVTTRQEVQIQDLALPSVLPIVRQLGEVSLTTKGAGGNTIRNITASPGAGLDENESVDVGACALELTKRLLSEPGLRSLPRKFKIAFAKDETDDVGATFNDLGFIAKSVPGLPGFEVRVAGGLGTRPRVGTVLHDFVPLEDTYLVAEALLRMFAKYGDRQNRNTARLRFLWDTLGEEAFVARYRVELEELRASGIDPFSPPKQDRSASKEKRPVLLDRPSTEEERAWRRRYVLPEDREGDASVVVPILAGDLSASQAHVLADLAEEFGRDALRFTTEQGVLLRRVPREALARVFARLRGEFPLVDAPRIVADSVACAGAGTCQLGICLSKNLLAFATTGLGAVPDADAAAGLRIHISGCPNNCGRHSTADLGFYGKAARAGALLFPAYRIVVGARVGAAARLAEEVGELYATQVPDFIRSVVVAFASTRRARESFADWLDRGGKRQVLEAIRDRRDEQIPDRESPRDWGAEAVFSLSGRGAGECAAGP